MAGVAAQLCGGAVYWWLRRRQVECSALPDHPLLMMSLTAIASSGKRLYGSKFIQKFWCKNSVLDH